ncbi:hypothetical protein [Brotaphodocola sp.]|uniref:hypothetical protein n=1 Tax=Brotaphodocola sp. TaxID=3073577 RepID=UPI003D7D5146
MAYFDSAKNRALWSKELSALKEEKVYREKYGYTPEAGGKTHQPDNPHRVRITYAQLEREEALSRGEQYLKSMDEKREQWKKQREAEYQKEQMAQKERGAGLER